MDPLQWGVVGAIVVVAQGLMELLRVAITRKNGNGENGQSRRHHHDHDTPEPKIGRFNQSDRAKLDEIYASVHRDEWGKDLESILREIRQLQERMLSIQISQKECAKRVDSCAMACKHAADSVFTRKRNDHE